MARPPQPTMKIIIKDLLGVGHWRWIVNDDICSICRLAFEVCCPECKFPGDDCPLVRGECTHCFHMHCLRKWLCISFSNNQCPICRQLWKLTP